MSFECENLNIAAYASGFTLWIYTGGDKLSDIISDNYFPLVGTELKGGDMIVVSSTNSGTNVSSGALLIVSQTDESGIKTQMLCRSDQKF